MRLLSVNVSMPKEVPYRDKTITTGIFKEPVGGRVLLRPLNLEGDGQADLKGHGGIYKAAYVLSYKYYAHWERELGREGFPHGQFGENFTVEGMTDEEVHVGDAIERVRTGPGGITVHAMFKLLYHDDEKLEGARRALCVPALSKGWRGSFEKIVSVSGLDSTRDLDCGSGR